MADAALAALNANAPYRVVGLANQLLGWPSQLLPGAFMASVVARLRRRQVLPAAMQAAPALPSSLVRTAAPLLGLALGLALWRVWAPRRGR